MGGGSVRTSGNAGQSGRIHGRRRRMVRRSRGSGSGPASADHPYEPVAVAERRRRLDEHGLAGPAWAVDGRADGCVHGDLRGRWMGVGAGHGKSFGIQATFPLGVFPLGDPPSEVERPRGDASLANSRSRLPVRLRVRRLRSARRGDRAARSHRLAKVDDYDEVLGHPFPVTAHESRPPLGARTTRRSRRRGRPHGSGRTDAGRPGGGRARRRPGRRAGAGGGGCGLCRGPRR